MLAVRVTLIAAALALGACTRSTTLIVDAGPPFPTRPTGMCLAAAPIDLLFMIDNSGSMVEEQASLGAQLPRLFTVLATGDVDGDGVQEALPAPSIHAGVITSDMGTGGFVVPTCAEPNFGDDGILHTRGNTARAGCNPTYPPFVDFTAGGNVAQASNDFACVAVAGSGGCGFEQQLDAVLKALTPSTSEIRFATGTSGHGDLENSGFLRPDSLLAIVLVTDEEDCSVADPELFNPDSSIYPGDLNLRCFQYPSAVLPTSRYVDGLIALRAARPWMLTFAAITGIPARLSMGDPYAIDYDAILADPEMQEQIDPAMPTRLTPSCNVPGRGVAFAPRRIVTVARDLSARGATGIVQSICQEDFKPAFNALIVAILDNACARYAE